MANNLNEYYKGLGQNLPSVQDRQGIATKAGITDYTGTAEQNASLLGYLENTPSSGNVITPEAVNPEKKIQIKDTPTDTSGTGMISNIGTLASSIKTQTEADQKAYDTKSQAYAQALKDFGDTTAFNEKVYKEQGVDTAKKVKDNFLSQIEAEQNAVQDRIDEIRKSSGGLTAGANAEIARVQRESANKLAKLGIGLSSATRNYETANNIATRLIDDNTSRLKSNIESQKFILDQLGTKLATEKSDSLTIALKQIDTESELVKSALTVGKNAVDYGTIDSQTYSDAVSDLTTGKISRAEFYDRIGSSEGDTVGIINGYDINSYATDPQHEQKVTSIYNNITGSISDENSAENVIKGLSPNSPITGKMVIDSATKYGVDPKLMISLMQQDSSLGTAGLAIRTKNAGNVGNDDAGNTQTFKNWGDGVDAVAKWLSNHKNAKKRYTGEFQMTIETAIDNTTMSNISKVKASNNIKTAIANGDYKSAYTKLKNLVSQALTGENQTQFDAKDAGIESLKGLKDTLQAYYDAGGKTGILKGTWEDINASLGRVSDPKFKTLAVDLKVALQKYRQNMTGSAFSDQEARDYGSVNPSASNNIDLNLSIIDGLYNNFTRQINSIVDRKAGEGAKYMREYAEMGTQPSNKIEVKPIPTPDGNSYTIIPQ